MANEKHVFIGIGGSGCQTVAQVKEKVYEKLFPKATKSKGRMEAMNESYRFLFLDTDSRDIDERNKTNRKTFEDGRVLFINPQTDLINLGDANPKAIYYEAQQKKDTLLNKRILEACSEELAAKIPDMPLAFGAGAFRMKSRIAFAHSLTDFQNKFHAAVGALNDIKTVGGEKNTIFYWVVGSSVGGTGSGIINDVLYQVNMIHQQIVGDGDPQLFLTMYMPEAYIERNHTEEKYSLNAFAVLSEMEAFKVMSKNNDQNKVMHRMAFMSDYNLINKNRPYSPFYYMIPVDIQTDKGTNFGSPRTMYRNTAELLFHLHAGQGGMTHRSNIDNYMNDIMDKTPDNFCVPMGYVALRKPTVEFDNYFRFRFRKDIIGTWLLNPASSKKGFIISENENEEMSNLLFSSLEGSGENVSHYLMEKNSMKRKLEEAIEEKHKKINEDEFEASSFKSKIRNIIKPILEEGDDDSSKIANSINYALWKATETMIRQKGLCYTIDLLNSFRNYLKEKDQASSSDNDVDSILDTTKSKCGIDDLAEKAGIDNILEKVSNKANVSDVQNYYSGLISWLESAYAKATLIRLGKYLKKLYLDDNKCEIVILRNRLSKFKDKAEDMKKDAEDSFYKLASKCNEAKNDVTTVYLPMLKKICDGDGWIKGNYFSNCYKHIIVSDDECNAERDALAKMVDDYIYRPGAELEKEIHQEEFYVTEKDEDDEEKAYTRFFANPRKNNVDPQNIIENFMHFCTKFLTERIDKNDEINKDWNNKGIYKFFSELTLDEKDEVRKSLSPALFFSYNNNNNALQAKSEPMIFIAKDEDLARDMLGYNKANPDHRFEKDDDDSTALVLRSKIGLSLHDYRVYEDLERHYAQASFREKYHFHHDFAQYGKDITLDNLPDNVMPEHYTFVKLLLLRKYENDEDFRRMFYSDKFDKDVYQHSMYFQDPYTDKVVWMAHSDAFSQASTGQLCLMTENRGHLLYEKISGKDFLTRFEYYSSHFQSLCFGETLQRIIMAIISYRNTTIVDGEKKEIKGEAILNSKFDQYREELLEELAAKKRQGNSEEKRLWNIFYEILRDRYEICQDFIDKDK